MLDAYGAAAQYHDLLHARETATQVRELVKPLAGGVKQGILDLGAGTGVAIVEAAALVPKVPIVAVEPSRAMRTALFGKLVNDERLRSRTTVLTNTAEQLDLSGAVDLALCLNTSDSFPPPYRPDIWERVHKALAPGGFFILDQPTLSEPAIIGWAEFGRVEIGRHTLVETRRGDPAGQRQWWEFQYAVYDQPPTPRQGKKAPERKPLTTESLELYTWPVSPEELHTELEQAGFAVKDTKTIGKDNTVLVLQRR